MKRYTALFAYTTACRAKLAAKEKVNQLLKDGYLVSQSNAGCSLELWLDTGELLRLEYLTIASVDDAYRQTAGMQYFNISLQEDGSFSGQTVMYLFSRIRMKAPEGNPVREGALWQVISRG